MKTQMRGITQGLRFSRSALGLGSCTSDRCLGDVEAAASEATLREPWPHVMLPLISHKRRVSKPQQVLSASPSPWYSENQVFKFCITHSNA